VDRERRIRFWNHGAEHITGYLAHEVVGHVLEAVVQACDRQGNSFSGEQRPVTVTLTERLPQSCTAFFLHKSGHRIPVNVRTLPIAEPSGAIGGAIGGATVLFEEAFMSGEESSGPAMYGCLDTTTGLPSRRLTQAVLNECIAGLEKSHLGFGLLRISGIEAGRVSGKTRSAVGRAFSAHRGAHVATQPGRGKLCGMLGRERVSGGAALGESGDGGNDG